MPLTGEALRRRILSAAALQGRGMRELRDALQDYGANRTLAESMIRGDSPANERNLRDLCEVLQVPRDWLTDEEWSPFASSAESEVGAEVRALARLLHERWELQADAMEALQGRLSELGTSVAALDGRLERLQANLPPRAEGSEG